MQLLGVGNHSPEQVISWLVRQGYKHTSVTIVPSGKKLSPAKAKRYKRMIMFSTFKDFRRNWGILNESEFENKIFFVLGTPPKLYEFDDMTYLDFDVKEGQRSFGFRLYSNFKEVNLRQKGKNRPTRSKSRFFMPNLIEAVKQGSLLNKLMSAIYTVKGSSNQKLLTLAIASWLYESESPGLLKQRIQRYGGQLRITELMCDRLEEILLSDIGFSFQDAFAEIRKYRKANKEVPYRDIGHKYGIPDFELRYITVKLDNEKNNKTTIDQRSKKGS